MLIAAVSILSLLIGVDAFVIRQHQMKKQCPAINRNAKEFPCGIGTFHTGTETNKIYRGIPAKLKEYPFAMPILFTKGDNKTLSDTLCTGTLISDKYIITAAHCFPESVMKGDYKFWSVYGVVKDLEQARADTCNKFGPVQLVHITNHPKYQGENGNDVALVEMAVPLPKEIVHSGFHRAACLPKANMNYGGKYTIYGFGYDAGGTEAEKKHPIKLAHAEVEERPRQKCMESWKQNVHHMLTEDEICMSESGSMGCVGDSGGPILNIVNDVHTIVGVLHGGTQCDATKELDDTLKEIFGDLKGQALKDAEKEFKDFKGAIYTHLGFHLDWICKVTKICSRDDQTIR